MTSNNRLSVLGIMAIAVFLSAQIAHNANALSEQDVVAQAGAIKNVPIPVRKPLV